MDGFTGKMDDENEVHLRPRKMDLIIEEMDLVQIKPSGKKQIVYNNPPLLKTTYSHRHNRWCR